MMVDLEELTELVELDQKCNGFKDMHRLKNFQGLAHKRDASGQF